MLRVIDKDSSVAGQRNAELDSCVRNPKNLEADPMLVSGVSGGLRCYGFLSSRELLLFFFFLWLLNIDWKLFGVRTRPPS